MSTEIQIRGMSFFYNDDGTRKYRTLALAEVYLPDLAMTLRDVRLAWSPDRGFAAHAPVTAKGATSPAVKWYHRGEFAQHLARELRAMWVRMGGTLPDGLGPKEQAAGAAARRIAEKAPARRDHVTGKPIGDDPFERRGVSMAQVADLKEHTAGRDEAVEGLYRTLGIEQEEVGRAIG